MLCWRNLQGETGFLVFHQLRKRYLKHNYSFIPYLNTLETVGKKKCCRIWNCILIIEYLFT